MPVIKPYSASYALSQSKPPAGRAAPAASAASAESATAQTAAPTASLQAGPAQQARQQLQSSLQQSLGKFMQQLKVTLRPLPKRSPEVDGMQKEMLKKKVDMLLQMAQMAGRDKASLKALAAELARAVKELKQLVASMTQNAADSMMPISVGGDAAAAASAAASGEGAPESTSGGGDVSGAAAQAQIEAKAQTAEDETRQTKDGEGNASAAGARGDAAAANGDKSAGAAARDDGATPRAGGGNPLAGGNPVAGDRVIQDIMMKLKQLQNWLKQQTRQLQADQELRKMMKEMDKDMAGIEKMLATGEVSENGEMDVQVHLEAEAGGGVNVQA